MGLTFVKIIVGSATAIIILLLCGIFPQVAVMLTALSIISIFTLLKE